MPRNFTEAQAEVMVIIVFDAGAEALNVDLEQRSQLEERLVLQLRMISKGALLVPSLPRIMAGNK
ncbi:MAG: HTH-type transcriptional repressor FabR [Sodalis sp.]|nr:MAG: HTH-type transcriptional repressor FabR [Sodalis sp.]